MSARRRKPSGPTYAVDTSTWIALDKRTDFDAVWSIFRGLIEERRLITAPEILQELKHPDYRDTSKIYAAIRPFEHQIAFRRMRDQNFHDILGELHLKFPQLCKSRSPDKRPADPWVIATAKRCSFDLVSEETLARRPNRKIPKACDALKVRCITISELLEEAMPLFYRK